MIRSLSKQSRDRIAATIKAAARRRRPALPAHRSKMVAAYCEDVVEHDLLSARPDYLAAAVLSHLAWGLSRRRGRAKIRVFNPEPERDGWSSAHTIIQIVNDDMPFLVDSLTMCLNELGRGIEMLMHPLLTVDRDRGGTLTALTPNRSGARGHTESFIYMEIAKELDESDLERIAAALASTLNDVRAAVDDWQPMLDEMRGGRAHIAAQAAHLPQILDESCALLDWLADDHFTLLGFREYRLRKGRDKDRLVPVAGSGLGLLRDDPAKPALSLDLSGEDQREARSRNPLVITRSRTRSTVHRQGYLDQVSIKVFGKNGTPIGVKRFVGLYTSMAFNEKPGEIPLVRLKVAEVVRQSGLDSKGHRGKALLHILNTFPREDLFQISIKDLARISLGVINLQERKQVRLFYRRDALSRYYSCFVYLPRDHYSIHVRKRIEKILLDSFAGEHIETKLTISESVLARLEAAIRTDPAHQPTIRLSQIEAELRAAVESWDDHLRAYLLQQHEEHVALRLLHRFSGCFPVSYQEEVGATRAAHDIAWLAAIVDGESDLELSLGTADEPQHPALLRLRACRLDSAIPLYEAVPILERMGLKVLSERVYRFDASPRPVWLQEFDLTPTDGTSTDPNQLEQRFLSCFRAVLDGRCENDRFNALILLAGLEWREAVLLRAYCKYLLQTGLPFSQTYMQQVLARHIEFTRAIVDQFHANLDPDLNPSDRRMLAARSESVMRESLERVTSLDEDRILRAFLGMLKATLRTNFYQLCDGAPKDYVSFKLDPKQLPELPLPRPMFEIFVYSPRVEGVHLRCGHVARGGLRWSDRREDFRTEILGLMKAQQVKNTIIVPTGAKGGFVCKQLPDGDREAIQAEVVTCYRTFVRALLDITDNIVDGKIATPARVLRRDGNDPYLVVAADKGTATFSDIANAISAEYDFWLGDAFASGGSAGYDHKKMAITARGAWESVKRHFRGLGIDPQTQPFTVIGIGDMSGDVFGNGMLLSKHLRLVAAFNHRHIFVDPNPDPVESYFERQRLFQLPRSGWDDYDRSKLSAGGGIYSRQSKSITLTPQAQEALGTDQATLTPPELVRTILRAPVDLLWNGGIGTYVKAHSEANSEAGDPSNDAVRVNADELRCRAVAEGGNLGLTQRARIEFAQRGGLVNADFIDNSAGVDSSDREVNIKILLNQAIGAGLLAGSRRNSLLATMTDEIAALVLDNNFDQTQALSVMNAHSFDRLGENGRLIRLLEARGILNRALEYLPADEALAERAAENKGLTQPELAIVFSYAKIALTGDLHASSVPEEPYFDAQLIDYFPRRLGKRFAPQMRGHRLRREIMAMRIANEVINRMGPAFVFRAVEDTASSVSKVIRAYAIARDTFDLDTLWSEIEVEEKNIPPSLQSELFYQLGRLLRRASYWLLHRHPRNLVIGKLVTSWKPMAAAVLDRLLELESPRGRHRLQKDIAELTQMGVNPALAHRIAALTVVTQILDIIEVTEKNGLEVTATARLYFDLAQGLELGWVREEIEELAVDGRWQAVARDTLLQNLARQHTALLGRIVAGRGKRTPHEALIDWFETHGTAIARVRQIVQDMRTQEGADFATLSVAIREIERLG
jgi:glutamate dehydrogenase